MLCPQIALIAPISEILARAEWPQAATKTQMTPRSRELKNHTSLERGSSESWPDAGFAGVRAGRVRICVVGVSVDL